MVSKKNPPLFLICVLALFSSWGEGLKTILIGNPSKLFPVISLLIIMHSIIASNGKITIYFKRYYKFICYIAMHTLIVYLLFVPEEFGYGMVNQLYTSNGLIYQVEGVGSSILRFLLFAMLSFSLISIFVKFPNSVNYFITWLNLGLLLTILIGGYQAVYSYSELRISGGFSNPNAYGFIGTASFFLSLYNIYSIKTNLWLRRLSFISVITSSFVIISSGSRGAFLAVVIGLMYLYLSERNSAKKAKFVVLATCTVLVVLVLLPDEIKHTFLQRISIERAIEDRGAHRIDIWKAYLSQWQKYLFWGIGFDRSASVLVNTNLYNKGYITHNTYLGILVEFGVVALGIYLALLVQIWRKYHHFIKLGYNKMKFRTLGSLLIAFAIQSFFMNVLSQRITWLIFSILISNTICSIENNMEE